MKISTLIFFTVMSLYSQSQVQRVDIPGSEVRKITSSFVAGQEYELQIFLPGGYKNSTKKYPVVYLMDSQWDFPLVISLYGEQYYDGFIPELIIVGVTWGGNNPNYDSLRSRDYTPSRENRLPQSGGADPFLSFMKNELFPFIETNYKADPGKRTLMGCSLGGLLTLYTLFTQPDLFTGYAAASPAIEWDNGILFKYEKEFAQKKLSAFVRVYMTVGDVERSRPLYEKFAETMMESKHKSMAIYSKILANTGHSGTKNETFARGLQYVFERRKINLPDTILAKYTGSYQSPDGDKIDLKNENGRLALYFSPGNKYLLYTASETYFYSTAEFFHVRFKVAAGKTEGFQLERWGNTQFIKRTN